MDRLILLVESRIRGDVYVRFGGELPKTHRSNTAGRWMLSLPCYDDIVRGLQKYGMHLLEHKVDTLRRDGEEILIAGVRNPFNLKKNGTSPTLGLSPDDFVILLTHTPDYAEDVPITNTDLVLAGHTHGGQVTLFGLYAPIIPSHYGKRFRTGLKYNSHHIPMIITNGIGTSNKNIRLFAPSEVVMIILHQQKD